MSDILDRLKGWTAAETGDSGLFLDIQDAIAEIEGLRDENTCIVALAGAVSDGPSMADIKANLVTTSIVPNYRPVRS